MGTFTFSWHSRTPVAMLVECWLFYHTHTPKSVSCAPLCCRPALRKRNSAERVDMTSGSIFTPLTTVPTSQPHFIFQRRKLGSERGSDIKSQEPWFALGDFDLSVFPHWHCPSSFCQLPPSLCPPVHTPAWPPVYSCQFLSCLCFFFWLCWVFVAARGLSLVAALGFLFAVASLVAEHRI